MSLRSDIVLAFALAVLPVQELGAAPAGGSMGVTSKAVLHVTVSVRARTGLSSVSSGGTGRAFCLWSTWKDKKFMVSLSGSTEKSAPIEIVAGRTPRDCAAQPAHLSLGESTLYTKGSQLLLIAPE